MSSYDSFRWSLLEPPHMPTDAIRRSAVTSCTCPVRVSTNRISTCVRVRPAP